MDKVRLYPNVWNFIMCLKPFELNCYSNPCCHHDCFKKKNQSGALTFSSFDKPVMLPNSLQLLIVIPCVMAINYFKFVNLNIMLRPTLLKLFCDEPHVIFTYRQTPLQYPT